MSASPSRGQRKPAAPRITSKQFNEMLDEHNRILSELLKLSIKAVRNGPRKLVTLTGDPTRGYSLQDIKKAFTEELKRGKDLGRYFKSAGKKKPRRVTVNGGFFTPLLADEVVTGFYADPENDLGLVPGLNIPVKSPEVLRFIYAANPQDRWVNRVLLTNLMILYAKVHNLVGQSSYNLANPSAPVASLLGADQLMYKWFTPTFEQLRVESLSKMEAAGGTVGGRKPSTPGKKPRAYVTKAKKGVPSHLIRNDHWNPFDPTNLAYSDFQKINSKHVLKVESQKLIPYFAKAYGDAVNAAIRNGTLGTSVRYADLAESLMNLLSQGWVSQVEAARSANPEVSTAEVDARMTQQFQDQVEALRRRAQLEDSIVMVNAAMAQYQTDKQRNDKIRKLEKRRENLIEAANPQQTDNLQYHVDGAPTPSRVATA